MTTAPDRTRQQRLAALERADAVRLRRARLLAEVRSLPTQQGCEMVAALLGWRASAQFQPRMEPCLERLPIYKLLTCIRQVREERTAKMLRRLQINGARPISTLTRRQRQMLGTVLRAQGWRR